MTTNLEPIHLVWLKRDLRLEDHPPLRLALQSKRRVLLVYIFEEILQNDPHYSPRHFDFIKQSLEGINLQLDTFNSRVLSVNGSVIEVFESISKKFRIEKIWAHQETGLMVTYKRDLLIYSWCQKQDIPFEEKLQQGVFRGMKNRIDWIKNWDSLMNETIEKTPLVKNALVSKKEVDQIKDLSPTNLNTTVHPQR